MTNLKSILMHHLNGRRSIVAGLLLATAVGAATGTAATIADQHFGGILKDVQFGGFASQGYLKSSANDYLGDTSKGTFDFREYAVNGSWSKGSWRIGAQAFGQKLGVYGKDKIALDWASINYQPAQWFGLRVGRVKAPRGLYNEALDLDSTRPFVLLPQSVYDARLRDFSSAFNGAMIYGNVGLGRPGSVDYRVYSGKMPLSIDSGASDYFNTDAPFPNKSINIDSVVGSSLFWNTPISGLRAGYSFSRFNDFATIRFQTFKQKDTTKMAPHYDRHLASLEYTSGDWVFASEVGWENVHYDVSYPPVPAAIFLESKDREYYFSVSRRINHWLELGTYYSHSYFNQKGYGTTVVFPTLKQGDYALSARFDINDHLLFKIEGHYMDGAGKVFDIPSHPQPPAQRDNSWSMLAVKTTYSF